MRQPPPDTVAHRPTGEHALTETTRAPVFVASRSEDRTSATTTAVCHRTRAPTLWYRVAGMSCAGCASGLRRRLEARAPGLQARVSFAEALAQLTWPEGVELADVLAAEAKRGFVLTPVEEASLSAARNTRETHGETAWWRHFTVAVFFAMNLMFLSTLRYLGVWEEDMAGERLALLAEGALATPVVLYGGEPFHRKAWCQIRAGSLGMDTLISLGSLCAYALSWAAWHGHFSHAFFDTAAMLVVMLLAGRLLETSVRRRNFAALRELGNLLPNTVDLETDEGVLQHAPVQLVRPGAVVLVRPGARVPVDGEVIAGSAFLDCTLVTGESLPSSVRPGDTVTAGVVNLDGVLRVRSATAVGDRAVDRWLAQVQRFLMTPPSLERFADRVVRVFVPGVLGLAIAAAIGHAAYGGKSPFAALLIGIAVLVVACPCALGLATPLALVAAAGAAAKRGIFFRDALALEALPCVRAVAFDKTGTLTKGKPSIVQCLTAPGVKETAVRRLAAWAEREVDHPYAQALRNAAAEGDAPAALDVPAELRVVAGSGITVALSVQMMRDNSVRASLQALGLGAQQPTSAASVPRGEHVTPESQLHPEDQQGLASGSQPTLTLGRRDFVASALHPERLAAFKAFSARAEATHPDVSWVYLAALGGHLGALGLRDGLRTTSVGAVSALLNQGLHLAILSGDRTEVVQAHGLELGLDAAVVHGELSPEDKVSMLAKLRSEHDMVAYVGDGLNDGPALAAADVGVAVQGATDLASQSAHVVLLRGGLAGLAQSLIIARCCVRTLHQNIAWALGYNLLALPAAMAGWVHPLAAVVAMSASSLAVTLNAARLGRRLKA